MSPSVQVGRSKTEKVSATIPAVAPLAAWGRAAPERPLKMYLAVSLFMETRGMLSGLLPASHLLKYTQLINCPFIILVWVANNGPNSPPMYTSAAVLHLLWLKVKLESSTLREDLGINTTSGCEHFVEKFLPPSLFSLSPFLSLTSSLSLSSAFPHLMLRDCESVFARWHLVLRDTFLSVYIFFPTSLSWFTCKFSIVLPWHKCCGCSH